VGRGEIVGLLGENGAGKTTLMNIVYGLYSADAGAVAVNGREVVIRSPQDAVELGIGMVHQHFMLVPDMTVAENMVLGPSRLPGVVKMGDVARKVADLSTHFGLTVDPHARIDELPVGLQQRVEITKMLYRGARILILDEPTAALAPTEWKALAEVLRQLAAEGASIILITHKLDELAGIAERCIVLRDGMVVGEANLETTDKPTLARMMVGREVVLRSERVICEVGQPVLRVEGLSLATDGKSTALEDLDFEVCEGEILGIAGVAGNGQEELVEVLAGLRRPTAGRVSIDGAEIDPGDGVRSFIQNRGAIVPEDRHRAAVALPMTLWENVVMKEIGSKNLWPKGFLHSERAREEAREVIEKFEVRTTGVDAPLGLLSGGNQQKVVLGRELKRDPRLLIAAQPTRGLDIGAMEYVYRQLNEHKSRGNAVVLVSAELDEIFSMSDRVAVMYEGRIVDVMDVADATTERIGLLMAGSGTR
jgi:simple sugar transport system ATP-binding protein